MDSKFNIRPVVQNPFQLMLASIYPKRTSRILIAEFSWIAFNYICRHFTTPSICRISQFAKFITVNNARQWHRACYCLEMKGGRYMKKDTAKDPVCGMNVSTKKPQNKSELSGSTYYFCSAECQSKFDRHPEKFASARKAG